MYGQRAVVDCPDLAMGRHLAFPDLSTPEFLKIDEALGANTVLVQFDQGAMLHTMFVYQIKRF